jgi:predicted GNAT family N-acyltransferase
MAVLKNYRGRGIGRELLRRAVFLARRRAARLIFLHAQIPVVAFYQKMGFRSVGRPFVEAGIRHRKMVLADSPSSKGKKRSDGSAWTSKEGSR